MNTLEILVGPIACGKSTYSRERAAGGALVVNDDSIVMSVHGGNYDKYDPKLKPLYIQIETAIITAASASWRDVIIDRGCRSRACRNRFATLGNSLGFWVKVVTFPWEAAEVHAKRRFEKDARGLTYEKWLQIAEAHQQTFQPVLGSETYDQLKEMS